MTEMSVDTLSPAQTRTEETAGMTPEQELRFAELMVGAFFDPSAGDGAGLPALDVTREEFTGLGPAGVCLLTMCWTPSSTPAHTPPRPTSGTAVHGA
ncbi:hypothetical protein RM572_06530 [Streptomyces sp. DSM 42041]|uniref:Uncharacterized protein n=1 Tax=Streptomyces hazeniae TaxID=3075538 RepID=A0ABU2NN81_9ACTN|nr:hypothetical protein [Streptomyces sp. DSM 42041]MDT0378434.1 hypothetical protein [Streptomyces sp. DSM 42041]